MKIPKNIGIIGGSGQMGQWFKNFFRKKGYQVLISSRHSPLTNKELVKKSDVVLISVPIKVLVGVIKEVGPHMDKGALLMDVTSLKREAVSAMLIYSKAEVIGTHPLFGPKVDSLKGQTIVICPARTKDWLSWVKDVFKEAHLEIITPQEHDKVMAIIQALTHFFLLTFGLSLKEVPFSFETLRKYATPNFSAILERIVNLTTQNPEICASIQFDNQFYYKEVFPLYLKSLERLKKIVQDKNELAFNSLFNEVRQFFSNFSLNSLLGA
jgi:prephenate dehydrogenase